MYFVLLHGRPATGKLTVARALAARTGARLFHNHLVVDATLALYDFGTPGFIQLRDALWRTAFARALGDSSIPGILFTFNPENTVPAAFIPDLQTQLRAAGRALLTVELTCPEAEIERRLDSASRREHRKLTDAALYRTLRAQGVFDRPVMPPADLRLDTAQLSSDEAAQRIATHLARTHPLHPTSH